MSNFIKEWTHKEVEHLTKSFRRYSIFVFILKFVLPLAAIAMAATLFIYPMLSDNKKKILLVAQEVKETSTVSSPVMTNPKFLGVDSKNQPYKITARKAVQEKDNILMLEGVVADITLIGDKWVSVIAGNGRFEQDKNRMELYNDVNLFIIDPDGETTQISTDSAVIDSKMSVVKSDQPVHIQSSTLNFTAQNFVLDKEKQKITFDGGVKLTIVK